MSQRFLSWDCAHKSLAWSYVTIDTHIYAKLSILADSLECFYIRYLGAEFVRDIGHLSREQLDDLYLNLQDPEFCAELEIIIQSIVYFTDNFICFHSHGVADILGGMRVSDMNDIARTISLHKWLLSSDVSIKTITNDTRVIIEQQPGKIGMMVNSKSMMVSHQLAFYYVNHNPVMINPKLKNNIALDTHLTLAEYKNNNSPYIARKKQSRDNFIFLLDKFNLSYITNGIPRANLDDLADSFMQIMAFIRENRMFLCKK